uniref:Envelope protein n=1 Tax=Bat Coronavirus HlYN20 TaxID=3018835 RepID=A0AA49EBX5_9NIDO|nr:envelope protein [Bat Coronavirus HlYN20]WCC61730.1 envelope protein [Bat Coronavirus HlYN20]
MLTLVNDNGLIVSAILLLILLLFVLLIAVTVIKLIQLCFTCHKLMRHTIYVPVHSAYKAYKTFMQVEPLPILDV